MDLLARAGADEPAAELYGAVTAALVPSFGVEARRLATAWNQVSQRLGSEATDDAVRRGRALSQTETADRALQHLDALLDD